MIGEFQNDVKRRFGNFRKLIFCKRRFKTYSNKTINRKHKIEELRHDLDARQLTYKMGTNQLRHLQERSQRTFDCINRTFRTRCGRAFCNNNYHWRLEREKSVISAWETTYQTSTRDYNTLTNKIQDIQLIQWKILRLEGLHGINSHAPYLDTDAFRTLSR